MPKSKEHCQEIREETKKRILQESILYFARNGFAGTKIGNLAKEIGIAQGTIYTYFESKEALFKEIYKIANNEAEIERIMSLSKLPIPARLKIHMLSEQILTRMEKEEQYAAKVALCAQLLVGTKELIKQDNAYQSKLYHYTADIIAQGQKEKTVVSGSALKLADYYWSVVYMYALKQLFVNEYEMIDVADLERILVLP